jgi:uncharacterized Fe-S cluster-containing radical SAM superfamily protein
MSIPELAAIQKTLHEIPFPKKFAVETCAECNLGCSMCHHPTMQRPKGNMPFPLWQKCANEISATAPKTECWFSFCGEPFLEPDVLFRFLHYGKSVGLESLNVNTNGMLLTPDLVEPLLATGLDLIVFGIDGYTKETFEKIRLGATRDTVYSNVEYLLSVIEASRDGPEVQIQFIEMDENQHELDMFKAYWSRRPVTLKIRRKLSWGGKFEVGFEALQEDRIPCPWAVTMMHVFWDGRVPRCPGDTEGEEGIGNAWDESLEALWGRLGQYREKHLGHRWDELPERCHSCTDWATGAAERIRRPRGQSPPLEPVQ